MHLHNEQRGNCVFGNKNEFLNKKNAETYFPDHPYTRKTNTKYFLCLFEKEIAMIKFTPAVFAVKNTYQIMVRVNAPCVMWVRIGERNFYDDSNGILRSNTDIHRIIVPMSILDTEKKYTVCYRGMPERPALFPKPLPLVETEFEFRPLPLDSFKIYHVSDTHNMIDVPVTAANTFGDFDLLVFNGDLCNHSCELESFDVLYALAERLTHGNIPIIFARGNHDMRGLHAEDMEKYTPTDNGRSYYTVRLGSLWCIVLDCGEDKPDTHEEYGNTICCHDFRLRETEFLEDVINKKEYEDGGITTKLVISHHPFAFLPSTEPFKIEEELYRKWLKLLAKASPDLHLAGHMHRLVFSKCGDPIDILGQVCPTVVCAKPSMKGDYHAGTGFDFSKDSVTVSFTDSNGETLETYKINK